MRSFAKSATISTTSDCRLAEFVKLSPSTGVGEGILWVETDGFAVVVIVLVK